MNLELHLPLWAILYCGLIFANGIITIKMSNNKTITYMLSQLLSTAFMITFFFIYYGAVAGVNDKNIYIIMVLFILFQEIWVNKKLYKRLIAEQIPAHERAIVITVLAIVMLIFLLPMIFIVISLF
jgi:ABC-type multidrug transport system permease subunit